MKSFIISITVFLTLIITTGCSLQSEQVPIPDYPLGVEDIEASLEDVELSWTVKEEESTQEDTTHYTLYNSENGLVGLIDSTGIEDARLLQMAFMHSENDKWEITASLPQDEWIKAVSLATFLYGGFSSGGELPQDFNHYLKSDDFTAQPEQASEDGTFQWKWESDGINCVIRFRQAAETGQTDFYTILLYNDEQFAPQY